MLLEAEEQHQIHLSVLVAQTGLWAHPEIHARRVRETGSAAMYPNVRRARKGEARGQIVGGIRLDDNTFANLAIKRALGLRRAEVVGFETCHIWPRTYGRVLEEVAGVIRLHPSIEQEVRSFHWS